MAGALMLYLAVFGQWDSAMVTLASIAIAVPMGVGLGLALGIAAWSWRPVERVLSPILDLMQTIPTFAYLVPVLVLFGFGPVAALIATVIYRPAADGAGDHRRPARRAVRDRGLCRHGGLHRGAADAQGDAAGRAARPDGGGEPGHHAEPEHGHHRLDDRGGGAGRGCAGVLAPAEHRRRDRGGLAITALAIVLDRLGQALAARTGGGGPVAGPWWRRHPRTVLVLAVALMTGALGFAIPALQDWPEDWTVTTRSFWSGLMEWINVTYFDQLEAFRVWVLEHLLLPVKAFFFALPWPLAVGTLALAGWRLGGARLAALAGGLGLFIAATGLWEEAMTTLYLCGVSVVIAMGLGLPLGIWAAASDRAGRVIGAVVDTLQTLPSFVYLIPVVMLFRVGDFSALVAVVLFALVPAVKYTAHGLRSVPAELIEAAVVSGCTRAQILRKVRLPLAVPMILLGLNQTILLALSMLVITALVGTRDLGQEVYIALTKADVGRGLVAGLAIAAIAIIADRLIGAAAQGARARLEGGT